MTEEVVKDKNGFLRHPDGKFIRAPESLTGPRDVYGRFVGNLSPEKIAERPKSTKTTKRVNRKSSMRYAPIPKEESAKNVPTVASKLAKLNQRFVNALYRDFQNYGEAAIQQFREESPGKYVQLVATFIPKEQTLNVNQRGKIDHTHEHITTSETTRFLGTLLKQQQARENAVDVEAEEVVKED